MVIFTGDGGEHPEEMLEGEQIAGHTNADIGQGPSATDGEILPLHSTSRDEIIPIEPLHSTSRDDDEHASRDDDPFTMDTHIDCSLTIAKDVGTQEELYVIYGVAAKPYPAPVIPADAVLVHDAPAQGDGVLDDAPVVLADQWDGFTLVRSRKFGMRRGNYPEGPYVAPPEFVCTNEVPWLPKDGRSLRKIKKWSQARKGGYIGTSNGSAYFVYGSFGPRNLEY